MSGEKRAKLRVRKATGSGLAALGRLNAENSENGGGIQRATPTAEAAA
jgi:hypothetical protein